MARSDLLLNLVRAGAQGNQALFRKTVEALVAEERAKHHHVLADNLAEHLNASRSRSNGVASRLEEAASTLLYEVIPQRTLADLILPEVARSACEELVEEQHRSALLRSYNLEPRHRVLLTGPPGNGKTSLAEAIAEALMVPMLVVRYEGVIGSYLGETATRLGRLFDVVRSRRCLLFFDEFDAVGKERGDLHETGEIKRVVSSLLLQIDALPSHVVVVTASNHPELLDRAVWRRFQLRLTLPQPTPALLAEWFSRFAKKHALSLGYTSATLAEKLAGLSFAEAEEFGADVLRRRVLAGPEADVKRIVAQRLEQWRARSSAQPMTEG